MNVVKWVVKPGSGREFKKCKPNFEGRMDRQKDNVITIGLPACSCGVLIRRTVKAAMEI